MDTNIPRETEADNETYPVEPRYHPIHKIPRKIYDFLASAKLAMALLVIILCCCLAGVTLWRGPEAWRLIFNSLWFNSILVLLVINVACCFFGRIWGRRITVISFGMILFHLSFVLILLAIVFNSLFYFRGSIRLTEGETLPSGDPLSYDEIQKGRFFNLSRLKGDTSLIKMHTGYSVMGENKRAAYEVSVGEPQDKSEGTIYITHKLSHHGVDYFNDREGYSLLVMLSDKKGMDVYGAHIPLQTMRPDKNTFYYSTGYRVGRELRLDAIPFPPAPDRPLFALKTDYLPSKLVERGGDVKFLLYPLDDDGQPKRDTPLAEGKVAVGTPFPVGDEYLIAVKEVRYWVGMSVRYEPGKPVVLTSLWIGLFGMILTTMGRMFKKRGV